MSNLDVLDDGYDDEDYAEEQAMTAEEQGKNRAYESTGAPDYQQRRLTCLVIRRTFVNMVY
jgi:hypothetical protein